MKWREFEIHFFLRKLNNNAIYIIMLRYTFTRRTLQEDTVK